MELVISDGVPARHRPLPPKGGADRLFGCDGKPVAVIVIAKAGQFDIEAERTHFLHENVEAFWDTAFERIVAADDGFVNLGTHLIFL